MVDRAGIAVAASPQEYKLVRPVLAAPNKKARGGGGGRMVRVAGPGPEESDLGCDIERYRGMVLYRLWVGPAQVDG